jgi:hypothetical protein
MSVPKGGKQRLQRHVRIVGSCHRARNRLHSQQDALGKAASGEVMQKGMKTHSSIGLGSGGRDRNGQLDWKLVTLAVNRAELEPLTEHGCLAGAEEALQTPPVRVPVALGDDHPPEFTAQHLGP